MTAPPHAILIWCDQQNIYAAPREQPDRVITFQRSENGLARTLDQLTLQWQVVGSPPYDRPQITPTTLVKQNLTLDDLARASAALRELGIIK